MWVELIQQHSEIYELSEPANPQDIIRAEKELRVSFPEDLKNALLESNGILGEYGLGLLWSIDRILKDNLDFRNNKDFKELYMSFDNLLSFADAGNGDQFAYPIHNGQIIRNDIFCWNHENDSRNWVAPSLEKYFEWWLTGKMTV